MHQRGIDLSQTASRPRWPRSGQAPYEDESTSVHALLPLDLHGLILRCTQILTCSLMEIKDVVRPGLGVIARLCPSHSRRWFQLSHIRDARLTAVGHWQRDLSAPFLDRVPALKHQRRQHREAPACQGRGFCLPSQEPTQRHLHRIGGTDRGWPHTRWFWMVLTFQYVGVVSIY